MKFEEIINDFRAGKNITRAIAWNKDFYGINKEWSGEIFKTEDILADDWELVE